MSLVVLPFKTEDPSVVLANVATAAGHDRVTEVLLLGYEENETWREVESSLADIGSAADTPVGIRAQERLGSLRAGKGDGMNTALHYFLYDTDHERVHFYDSDITSFGPEWITKAEEAADVGYGVVRHYFPRASTDGMITWMIARTGFAMLWPRSELPWIEQPLGGELLFTRQVVGHLLADDRVVRQSDWGIDTLYTFSTTQARFPLFETYVPIGKAHRLYGRLTDLRAMLVECFAAIQGLRNEAMPDHSKHRIEYPDVVPHEIAEKLGYDVEATMRLLSERWSERQLDLLNDTFPVSVREGLLANRARPVFDFMDEWHWYDTFGLMLDRFVPGDEDWEELLFKLWVVRVLNFTARAAVRGYSYAMRHLHRMVYRYLRTSALAG